MGLKGLMHFLYKKLLSTTIFLLLIVNPSFSQMKSKKIDFSDIDYIYICSNDSGVDSKLVSKFYLEFFDNEKIQIFDGVPDNRIIDGKRYLLMSFGLKPIKQNNINCLKNFPLFPDKWIDKIVEQNNRIGTVPEFLLKKYGQSVAPVTLTVMHDRSNDDNVILSSAVFIKSNNYFSCASIASAFRIDYNLPNSKVKCSSNGGKHE